MKRYLKNFCIALALILTLAACGEKPPVPDSSGASSITSSPVQSEAPSEGGAPMTKDEIAEMEALYEKGQDEAMAALKLTLAAEQTNPMLTAAAEQREMAGQKFTTYVLLTAGDSSTFYGVDYMAPIDDSNGDAQTVLKTLYDAINAAYGEATTYPGTQNRIGDKLAGMAQSGIDEEWKEDWTVGERTDVTLRATPVGDGLVVLYLHYQMKV